MKNLLMITALLLGSTVGATAEDMADATVTPAERVRSIEIAHNAAVYEKQSAVQAKYKIKFGPMEIYGRMTFTPSMGKVLLGINGGHRIGYDGKTAWTSDALVSNTEIKIPGPPPRFHVLTWPYFMAVPYKLNDPGTQLSDAGMLPVREGESLRGTKVTFDSGIGDTPDDWYIAFADPATGRLSALAYIVTFGKDQSEAEKTPGIILYDDFVEIDGVPFATTWTFHHWNQTDGIHGEPKGSGKLSNVEFVERDEMIYEKMPGAIEATMPGS